jgi:hypothetical protein
VGYRRTEVYDLRHEKMPPSYESSVT